jgi:acetyl-CoA acetyltransferase
MGPPTLFTIPVLRYMKTYGLMHEQLAMVSVVQREWAGKNPRATFRAPITVEDVLNSRMIAYRSDCRGAVRPTTAGFVHAS